MPNEESLDLLAKEVTQTGRTFSVFDLAKVLLQGRDRFRVIFENKEKPFFRCREDSSVWLTKEEALGHVWKSEWRKKFYTEIEVEGEAPKGSFSSVAKCGMSGTLLGPPNHHAYQQNVAALHRERFSNMSLERFKSRIVMEQGEEAVEAWVESMKTVTQWKIADPSDAEVKEEEPQAEEVPVSEEAPAEEVSAEAEAAVEAEAEAAVEAEAEAAVEEESAEVVSEGEEAEVVSEEEPAEVEASEGSDDSAPAFKTSREVEQHFVANHFKDAFEETNRAWVLGNIEGKLLSPGLLSLLKISVMEEKRYPANLMPIVCRQLSGRHVAVFKWKKKLKVGPSRPHAVSDDMKLAERPAAIIEYLKENSGKNLKELWAKFLPEGTDDETKSGWYHDLHWLLNQGHVILLSDTSLHLAKSGDQVQQAPAKKSSKKKAAKETAKAQNPAKEEAAVPKSEDGAVESPDVEKSPDVPAAEVAPEAEAPVAKEVSEVPSTEGGSGEEPAVEAAGSEDEETKGDAPEITDETAS
ncbi:MAG: hypothetical protein ACSHYF_13715 [Verrucomicrobiaceae bacterium]